MIPVLAEDIGLAYQVEMDGEVSQTWSDFLDWYCRGAGVPHPPDCPREASADWAASRHPAVHDQAKEALIVWMMTWEWPEMSPEVQGLVHLRLYGGLKTILRLMAAGEEAPRGETQRRMRMSAWILRD